MAGKRRSGMQAYKAPIVLREVEATVNEPYRTLLLVHAHVSVARTELAAVELDDVQVDDDRVLIKGKRVKPKGVEHLRTYLRGYRKNVVSDFLFPLPSDPGRHANEVVAKRKLAKIKNAR